MRAGAAGPPRRVDHVSPLLPLVVAQDFVRARAAVGVLETAVEVAFGLADDLPRAAALSAARFIALIWLLWLLWRRRRLVGRKGLPRAGLSARQSRRPT